MAKEPRAEESEQLRNFQNLARELEADEDPEAFKAKLVKVARAPRKSAPKN